MPTTMRILALLLIPAASEHSMAAHGDGEGLDGEWTVENHPPEIHPHGYYVMDATTYKSPMIKLMTGAGIFSLNPITPIPFPTGDYTVLRVDFDMLDDQGKQANLAEVYNHHWLIGEKNGLDVLSLCEGDLFFGAGAEMRGTPTIFPDGYGAKRIGSKGRCGGNLHFIRTEDLKTSWNGFNDPKGDYGAAVKNCMECGYAPGRASGCSEGNDGQFACCVTGSRCPVNNPNDKTKKGYQLQYKVQYTRNLTASLRFSKNKELRIGVFDISGGAVEWNVAPKLNSPQHHQTCTDTVCTITNSMTVGTEKSFKNGICSGTMVWSYLHQHVGAIDGTMSINGKHYCTSSPHVGTDPNNAPGNEKGYVVGFSKCVDKDVKDNAVRLNKGDVITVTARYDVDPRSTVNAPLPGGKHGGIMGLFFHYMDCDPGSFTSQYVCRENMCLPVMQGEYKNLDACNHACSGQQQALV